MADSILKAIDSFYDVVDRGVGVVSHVLDRSEKTDVRARTRLKRTPDVIDAESVSTPIVNAKPPKAQTSTALAARRFRIIEAIAPDSGATIYVVTNGKERAECATRVLAEKILRGLETSK